MKYYKLKDDVFVKTDGEKAVEINSATGSITIINNSIDDYMHDNFMKLEDISHHEFDEQYKIAASLINSLFAYNYEGRCI